MNLGQATAKPDEIFDAHVHVWPRDRVTDPPINLPGSPQLAPALVWRSLLRLGRPRFAPGLSAERAVPASVTPDSATRAGRVTRVNGSCTLPGSFLLALLNRGSASLAPGYTAPLFEAK
jgi:hypothetical protein